MKKLIYTSLNVILPVIGIFLSITTRDPYFNVIYDDIFPNSQTDSVHRWLFVFGVFISLVIMPIRNAYLDWKLGKYKKLSKENTGNNRVIWTLALASILGDHQLSSSSIRVFVPHRRLTIKWTWWKKVVPIPIRTKTFKNLIIDGLDNSDPIDKVSFTVSPRRFSQGLIGFTFLKKAIAIKEPNHSAISMEAEIYDEFFGRMDDYQKQMAAHHQFVLTIPVISKNNKVIAIISFDNNQNISSTNHNDSEVKGWLWTHSRKIFKKIKPIFQ